MPAEHSNSGANRSKRVFSQIDRVVIERASVSEAARAAVVECAEEARLDGDQKVADRLMVLVGEADRILKRRGHAPAFLATHTAHTRLASADVGG